MGRGFNGGGLSRREGRFSLYLFFEGLSKWEGRFQCYLFFGGPFFDAGGRRHGARSFVWLAGTVSGPYPFGFVRTTDISRASAGPAGACPTSADIFLRGLAMSPNSGGLPRQTAGALIVTLLVTIQGTARALKHARAPSRPGTNGGAQAATCNAPSPS